MRKGKGVLIEEDVFEEEEAENDVDDTNPTPPPKLFARSPSSKYDFVKVKVWLGDNADHYYVLSRFLLSRMLTVTKIPNHVAIKIALELKKLLIDNSLLDISQSDLEANLFKLMQRRGYGEEYINRYKMMTRFHHQRVPFVILVCGTACVGKSTIATQLAQRLNLPNVLQTDMVYELIRTATDAPLTSSPVWARDFSSSEELITEFCRECRIVRKGLAGDLKKAIKDGKPLIIEGSHLDPSIYLMDDESKSSTDTSAKVEVPNSEESEDKNVTPDGKVNVNDGDKKKFSPQNRNGTSADSLNKDTAKQESMDMAGKDEKVAGLKPPPPRKEKSGVEPIIVPIVLKMTEFDHKALLEEWLSTRTFSDKSLIADKDKLTKNVKTIQDYLCSFNSQGLTVVNISPTTFPQTLDWLHTYLLQCIEHGTSPASNGKSKQLPES